MRKICKDVGQKHLKSGEEKRCISNTSLHNKAFTLVELIVVITILAILATIGFVSFSGYLAGTRDTNRKAQLKSMSEALELHSINKPLPIPDDKIEIKADSIIIAYQGDIGKNVLETIEYTESGLDPKYKEYFSYYLTKNQKSFQLMAFLEEPNSDIVALNSFNKTNAEDYSERYPFVKGKKLGILTDINNKPVQKVETIKTAGLIDISNVGEPTEYKSIISNTETITGTGTALASTSPIGSCKRIKQIKGGSSDGVYIIDPEANGTGFEVYCDMTTDGGGWTMIARSVSGGTGNFGWNYDTGSISNNSQPYSMGEKSKKMNFKNIMVARYKNNFDIELAIRLDVDSDVRKNDITSAISTNDSCRVIHDDGILESEKSWDHCKMFKHWGRITKNSIIYFRDLSTDGSYGLYANKIFTNDYNSTFGAFNGKQGMIFVK